MTTTAGELVSPRSAFAVTEHIGFGGGRPALDALDLPSAARSRPRLAGVPDTSRTASFRSYSKRYAWSLASADAVVGGLSAVIGLLMPLTGTTSLSTFGVLTTLVAIVVWPIVIASMRGYEKSNIGVGGHEMRAVLQAGVLVVAAVAFPSAIVRLPDLLNFVVVAAPAAVAASTGVRFLARKLLHRRQMSGTHLRRVIVVGRAETVADLSARLSEEPHCGMQVVGVCVPRSDLADAQLLGLKVIGETDQVPSLVSAYDADAVAVSGGTSHEILRRLSWSLEGVDVELLVHPGLVEVAGPRMHIRPYVGLPLLHIEKPHFTGWRRFAKRATDVVMTSVGLLVISPVLLVIAAAIKLGDRGPVFFKQTRVGLDGSRFTMWKFRSMRVDAEARLAELRAMNPEMGLMFKMEDDPRITRVGRVLRRYSLDELPQLFNVLAGSMSLVGPRPPLPAEVEAYEDHARRRLLVTPGLTGLWQVSGRSLLSWEETVRLDLRYVENWNLTFDLHILWKTLFAVLEKKGAF